MRQAATGRCALAERAWETAIKVGYLLDARQWRRRGAAAGTRRRRHCRQAEAAARPGAAPQTAARARPELRIGPPALPYRYRLEMGTGRISGFAALLAGLAA